MDALTNVWNRAAMAGGGPDPRRGDTSLASVLGVHNTAMSGGLLNLRAFVPAFDFFDIGERICRAEDST